MFKDEEEAARRKRIAALRGEGATPSAQPAARPASLPDGTALTPSKPTPQATGLKPETNTTVA